MIDEIDEARHMVSHWIIMLEGEEDNPSPGDAMDLLWLASRLEAAERDLRDLLCTANLDNNRPRRGGGGRPYA
ncbi:MAG: hypothetical protein HRT64_13595 [Erythrobacter sp.]|nr:hypothetical protein [Erythrobacter sp.]